MLWGIESLGRHVDRICSETNVHRFSKSQAAISKLHVVELRHEDRVPQYKIYSLRRSGTRNLYTTHLETHQPPIQRVQEVGRSERRSVDLSKTFSKISQRATLQCLPVLLHVPDAPVSNLGPHTGYSDSPCGLL